jgi:hypothetical protein
MKTIKCLALASVFALAGMGAASAAEGAAGTWSINISGDSTPCALTLTADSNGSAGTAAPAADCSARAQEINRWSNAGSKLTLKKASGETIAVLNQKNDGYAGKRFSDSRKVTLEPAGSSVAQGK